MYRFRSKYALILYEVAAKRINLKMVRSERFSLAGFRGLLGVSRDDLPRFADFNRRAIRPAVTEVNASADLNIEVTPVTERRQTIALDLRWRRKDADELQALRA